MDTITFWGHSFAPPYFVRCPVLTLVPYCKPPFFHVAARKKEALPPGKPHGPPYFVRCPVLTLVSAVS